MATKIKKRSYHVVIRVNDISFLELHESGYFYNSSVDNQGWADVELATAEYNKIDKSYLQSYKLFKFFENAESVIVHLICRMITGDYEVYTSGVCQKTILSS